MKILFAGNTSLAKAEFGGREMQMLRTRDSLLRLGAEIELYNEWETPVEQFDILHMFGLEPENLRLATYCKNSGLKIVTSSVFYPLQSKNIWAAIARFWPKTRLTQNVIEQKARLLGLSDLILPNTREELSLLVKIFGVSESNCRVIPNGVDMHFADGDPSLFRDTFDIRQDFVLFVGRIERRKNLDKLIEATDRLRLPLVVVGSANREEPSYVESCVSKGRENTTFLGPLVGGSELLKSAYKACKVFALPSFYETPGISALEAGLAGATLLITSIGGTKEYFGQDAYYVNPRSLGSILAKLEMAWSNEKPSGLASRISSTYSWDNVGELTMGAYRSVLL